MNTYVLFIETNTYQCELDYDNIDDAIDEYINQLASLSGMKWSEITLSRFDTRTGDSYLIRKAHFEGEI